MPVRRRCAERDVLILIPARMASTRLPGKPLADIGGVPMIVHVMRRAEDAEVGPVVVATDSEAIAAAVEKAGGRAVMTRADHASGSDRIFEALGIADPQGRAGIVVNVQGDLPTLDARRPRAPRSRRSPIRRSTSRTLAAEITDAAERTDPERGQGGRLAGRAPSALRALYFTRATAPCGRRAALSPHRALCLSPRGARALRRAAALAARAAREARAVARARSRHAHRRGASSTSVPLGVDTPEDLETARAQLLARR